MKRSELHYKIRVAMGATRPQTNDTFADAVIKVIEDNISEIYDRVAIKITFDSSALNKAKQIQSKIVWEPEDDEGPEAA